MKAQGTGTGPGMDWDWGVDEGIRHASMEGRGQVVGTRTGQGMDSDRGVGAGVARSETRHAWTGMWVWAQRHGMP